MFKLAGATAILIDILGRHALLPARVELYLIWDVHNYKVSLLRRRYCSKLSHHVLYYLFIIRLKILGVITLL